MSVFKSLRDKVQAKKDELERKAAQKAAERAAEMALERGKQAARAAVEQAGVTLKNAGASIEAALFGPDSEDAPVEAAPTRRDEDQAHERPRREAQVKTRADDEERLQREVDEELAALKRKLGKK
jgi:hypothetical protein